MVGAFFGPMSGSRRNGSGDAPGGFRTNVETTPSTGDALAPGTCGPFAIMFGALGTLCAEGSFGARSGWWEAGGRKRGRFARGGKKESAFPSDAGGRGVAGKRRGPGDSPAASLVGGAPTVGRGAETVYGPLTMCMCGPFDEMSESRKNGSGEDSSSDAFSPKSSSSSEEIYHWTPVGGDVPMDGGGAGIVYEYECKDGAGWTASLGALGPKAGISEPRGKSSGEDSTAAFRTGAASRGRVGAAGGEIRSTNKFISGAMLEKILYVI